MAIKEGSIQKDIKDLLEAHGAKVFNPKTGSYSEKGTPDLLVCFHGLFVAIEVKVPGKKPSKLQKLRLQEVRDAGGIAFSANNLEEVKELINDISTIQCSNKSDGGMCL